MASRGIHLVRHLFTTIDKPLLIPPQGIIMFNNKIADYYTKITVNGAISYINQILFDFNTSIFRINTSSDTSNNFMLQWAVCLKSANLSQMPCFAVVVRNEDNTIFTTLPSNSVRKTTVVYGSSLLHLPTPAVGAGQVSYFLTLVNISDGDCFYSTKAIINADLMITCIDDE